MANRYIDSTLPICHYGLDPQSIAVIVQHGLGKGAESWIPDQARDDKSETVWHDDLPYYIDPWSNKYGRKQLLI